MKQLNPTSSRSIWQVPHLGMAGITKQNEKSLIRQLSIDYVMLVWIIQGNRVVRWGANQHLIEAGQASVTAPGVFDIENSPASNGEPYESHWIAWDLELLESIKTDNHFETATVNGAVLLPQLTAPFLDSYENARTALRLHKDFPAEIVRHRVMEPLIWLATSGLHFAAPTANQFSQKIRVMVTEIPAQEWSTGMLADAFSVSEATLRRRLAAEGTSASELVADARMRYAWAMLQSTDFPIWRVALDCGYASASQFARRFRDRFGIPPSVLRGHRRPDSQTPREHDRGMCRVVRQMFEAAD